MTKGLISQRNKPWLAFSNVVFVVPFILSLHFALYWHAIIVGLVIIFSVLYHSSKINLFIRIDSLTSYTLIIANLILCFLGRFSMPFFALTVCSVITALYFYFHEKRQTYVWYHIAWHSMSAVITICSILTYVYA
ncbi:MAG: hypothetical protein RLZZ347_751 [Candidatus Parcubacteria bacterium]|jgi:hypothetical protein